MKALGFGVLYISSIVAANVLTAHTAPLVFGIFVVTSGTWLIAATFPLRDAVQLHTSRAFSYAAIVLALVCSAATSRALGDTLAITGASALSFALSETLDTEAFTRLRGSLGRRVAFSGLVSGTLDSAVFCAIGLSPLGAGFVAWADLWKAILAQIVTKGLVQVSVAPVARLVFLMPRSAA